MKVKSLVALVLGLFIFSSCNSSDDSEEDIATAGEIKTYQVLDARSYTNWVYFSFSKNEIVTVTDVQADKNWDIAFHRGDVKFICFRCHIISLRCDKLKDERGDKEIKTKMYESILC